MEEPQLLWGTDVTHLEQKAEKLQTKATNRSQQTSAGRAIFESCGTKTIKGGIHLYIELQKHTLDQIAERNIRISLVHSFLEIKLWRL